MTVARAGNKVVEFFLTHPGVLRQVEAQRDMSSTSFDLSKSQLPSEWSDDDDHTVPPDIYSTPNKARASGTESPSGRSSAPRRSFPSAHTNGSSDSPYASIQQLSLPLSSTTSLATLIASPARTPDAHARTLSFSKTALAQFLDSCNKQQLDQLDQQGLRTLCLHKVLS